MRVAVIGANGQLGMDVVGAFEKGGNEVQGLTHTDIEVSNIDSVWHCLREMRPHLVVNTAAMHHVDSCEQNPEQAYAMNALGPRNVAMVARDVGSVLMHVSTDYVFDGAKKRPYCEQDIPQPLNVYGNTKLAGEHFVRCVMDRYFVLRTSALYGRSACRAKGGQNFIQLMLKLAKSRNEVRVVDTEIVTPTSTEELAHQMVVLSRADRHGLYHATAEGSCSWFEFAQVIFSITGTRTALQVAAPDEFPAKVPRPSYSVLENYALKSEGLNNFGPWQNGLRRYIDHLQAAA